MPPHEKRRSNRRHPGRGLTGFELGRAVPCAWIPRVGLGSQPTTEQLGDTAVATAREICGQTGKEARLTICAHVSEAVTDAAFLQESGPEDLPLKKVLYAESASALESASVVASSTSTLMPTVVQENLSLPGSY